MLIPEHTGERLKAEQNEDAVLTCCLGIKLLRPGMCKLLNYLFVRSRTCSFDSMR